jgi:CHASE3 domain sensor protein
MVTPHPTAQASGSDAIAKDLQRSLAERRLLEAKSAERGYLLTGKRSYLENFNRGGNSSGPLDPSVANRLVPPEHREVGTFRT